MYPILPIPPMYAIVMDGTPLPAIVSHSPGKLGRGRGVHRGKQAGLFFITGGKRGGRANTHPEGGGWGVTDLEKKDL